MKKIFVMVTAIVLLFGILFSMASLVSAGFVEEVLDEVCSIMRTSSNGGMHSGPCLWMGGGVYKYCDKHPTERIEQQVCKITHCDKTYWPPCSQCQLGN